MKKSQFKKINDQIRNNPDVGHRSNYPSVGAPLYAGMTLIRNEHDLQVAVFEWVDRIALDHPDYEFIYAIPNGQYRPGQRMEPGLRKGYPDIGWDLPRLDRETGIIYPGIRLELKVKKNKLSEDQERWAMRLKGQGYYVTAIWDSVEEVLKVLDWYYKLERIDLRNSVNLQSKSQERNSMPDIKEVFEPIDEPVEKPLTLVDLVFGPDQVGMFPHMVGGNVCLVIKSDFSPNDRPAIRLSPMGATYPTASVLRLLIEVLDADGLDDVPTEELESIFSADCFLNVSDRDQYNMIRALSNQSALMIHFYDEDNQYVSTTTFQLSPVTTADLRESVIPAMISHNLKIDTPAFDFTAAKTQMEIDFPFN
jgi:hypothetical protein